MIKIILSLLFISQTALAGLPPTTSRLSSDSNNVTTFNYLFPNFTGSHTGTSVSLGVNSIAGGGTGQATKAAAFDALSPMTTGGDLIYGGASGTGTRLANGSNGQYLTSGGGTSAPTWTTGLSNPLTTTGDIIYGVGATPTRLAAGSAGQVLTSQGVAAPAWAAVPSFNLRGEILGGNPSLGVGTNFATYTEITDAGLTLTPSSNSGAMSILCNSTNSPSSPSTSATTCPSGTESLGVSFNAPYVGWYQVCFDIGQFLEFGNTNGNYMYTYFQVIETPVNAQTLTQQSNSKFATYFRTTGATTSSQQLTIPISVCGSLYVSSVAQKAMRLMRTQDFSGTVLTNVIYADGAAGGVRNINVRVNYMGAQ